MADEKIIKPIIIKPIKLTAGVVLILSLIGASIYFIAPEDIDNLYYCNSSDGVEVTLCNKLSAINDYGIQSRCYYDLENPRNYKYCKTSWFEATDEMKLSFIEGESADVTELKDYTDIEQFVLKSDFLVKKVAEDYIVSVKSDMQHEYIITKKIAKPYSNEIEIYWRITLFKLEQVYKEINETMHLVTQKNIIYSEEVSSKVDENATAQEIEITLDKHAKEFAEKWRPNIEIKV